MATYPHPPINTIGPSPGGKLNQLSFLDIEKPQPKVSGTVLRDRGIKRAIQHSENIYNDWQRTALDFLYLYARDHDRFSGEMVRMEAKGIVPDPPSLRAWGAVLLQGARKGWIKRVGTIQVTNPRAHACFASEWESRINEM